MRAPPGRAARLNKVMWLRARAAAVLASPLRRLCTSAASATSAPAAPITLLQPPPLSLRRATIKQHGLIGLTLDHVKQKHKEQTGQQGTVDQSFRVQTFTVPLHRPAEFSVSKIYGFGRSRSRWLATEVGVFGHYKLSKMRESQRAYIRRALNAACIAYDDPKNAAGAALKKEIGLNIQRLKDIKCYRGLRHTQRLPCRGQ